MNIKHNPNKVLGRNCLFFNIFSVTIVTALFVQFVIIGPIDRGILPILIKKKVPRR